MPEEVKPLTEIAVIGKTKRGGEPFPIGGQRGLYFFIPVEEFDWLREVNAAYKTLYRGGVKPLERIKIVGRGGIEGYRPFLLPGHYGRYLCILAEHLRQLEDINRAYAELLEAKALEEERRKIEEARRVEVEKPPEGKYVYCVIPAQKEKLSFGNIGIEGNGEVYTISYGPIAAVVSDVPMKEYVLIEDNVGVHNQVISRVMEDHTVVPMAFGQVFKNEEILGAVLGKIRGEIKKAMEVAEGKVELGVKVILPEGAELDEDAFASDIKGLREIATQCKLGRRFSHRLILNAFYLVAKDKVDAFSEAVGKLVEKFKQLKIQYTGPWAPFNFATIQVGAG